MKTVRGHFAASVTRRVSLDYLFYLPDPETRDPTGFPLLLFLHGGGERGSDLDLVKKHGPPRRIERGARFPFAVAVPQCPADAWWRTEPLAALLDYLLGQYEIDERRLYLTGISMGGHGAWALAGDLPGRFAAVAPVCGPQAWINPAHFRDTPVWCFHGAMDRVVPLAESVNMVSQVRQAGGQVRFTVFPDAGHDVWTRVYRGPQLYEWFLGHRRPG